MSDQELREANMDLVRRYVDGINAWDFEGMREMLHEDFVFVQAYAPPGMQSSFAGRDAVLAFQQTFVDTIVTENLHDLRLDTLHADPAIVLAEYRSDMRFSDPAIEYRNTYVCKFEVRDGRLARFTEHYDPVPLILAFGGSVASPFTTPAPSGA